MDAVEEYVEVVVKSTNRLDEGNLVYKMTKLSFVTMWQKRGHSYVCCNETS